MLIPGFIISVLTFPGVVVHEFAHKLFCRITGTKVLQVCYFRLGSPAGFVIHEQAGTVWKHIIIGIGPFVVNTTMGFLIGLLGSRGALHMGNLDTSVSILTEITGEGLMWLAISIAMHSFPSVGDAQSIWSAVWQKGSPISARLVGTPLVAVICLGAVGSIFWIDLAYGIGVAWFLPKLLMG